MLPTSRLHAPTAKDPAMTWSEGVLWLLGGTITLTLGLADGAAFAWPTHLLGLGAAGIVTGLGLLAAWRRGGLVRRVLGGLAHLGTVLITWAVLAGGELGEVFVPLYGFVAVVAAVHMTAMAVVRHLAAVVAATALLVHLGSLSATRGVVLVLVVLVMGLVVGDVTRRHQRTVRRQQDQEAWRTAMLGALAHDIRTPLTVVRGALESLAREEQLDAGSRRALVEAAARQVARIEALSEDLLSVERVRDGRLELEPGRHRVADVVQRVAAGHEGVDVEVPSQLVVWADEARLGQVLNNLLRNADKHGAPPVQVTARAADGGVLVSVRDHGEGVPEELRATLFQRFSDGGARDSVGLGLWVARTLTEVQGGRIDVADASPGARFDVWLPSAPAADPVAATERPRRTIVLPATADRRLTDA